MALTQHSFWVIDNVPKIAYAASIGNEQLDSDEAVIIKSYLKSYRDISVREKSAQQLLESFGIDSVSCILDPTMQIPKEEWFYLSSNRLVKKKYLLLMLLYNEDNNATEIARRIADSKGLELVKLSWDFRKPPKVDKLMTHRTPEDFLSLFYFADYVVTNSFHGLCFAINFEKQFVAIKRNEFNDRLDNLLNLFSLKDRMVDIETYESVSMRNIDYNGVNSKLKEERQKAELFLNEALS